MRTIGWIVLGASLMAVSAFAQEGHKQTDRLIKRANDTLKSIGETKEQLQTTLAIYNSMFKGSGDTRRIHKDLTKAIENTLKRREDVRKKVAAMENEAHTFFAEWTESLDTISSESLRQRSKERLDATRHRYGKILSEGRRAGADFEPLMGGLRDQVIYLGYDLNPSAVASLESDAAQLNAQAKTLFAGIEKTQKDISDYIVSLKPE